MRHLFPRSLSLLYHGNYSYVQHSLASPVNIYKYRTSQTIITESALPDSLCFKYMEEVLCVKDFPNISIISTDYGMVASLKISCFDTANQASNSLIIFIYYHIISIYIIIHSSLPFRQYLNIQSDSQT